MKNRMVHIVLKALSLSLLFASQCLAANGPATLIADQLFIDQEQRLVASGSVYVSHQDRILTAKQIIYDKKLNKLEITGPIQFLDTDGNEIKAKTANIDGDLKAGLFKAARLVLKKQLRINAKSLERSQARFMQLNKVRATSCYSCNQNPPLWQIRAKTMRHDNVKRQVFFENATLHIFDFPVFFTPYLRLPDPGVRRMQGFLVPRSQTTTRLGYGLKLPYFIPIGESRDVTLTPYASPVTKTMEVDYRQAYAAGDFQASGTVSHDGLTQDKWRGYLFANGNAELPSQYILKYKIETVSDFSYLGDYEYVERDLLESNLRLSQTTRRQYNDVSIRHYTSLYGGNSTAPSFVASNKFEHRFVKPFIGGDVKIGLDIHGSHRQSNTNEIGRDLSRVNGTLQWGDLYRFSNGAQIGFKAQAFTDLFIIAQDTNYSTTQSAFSGAGAISLAWPLLAQNRSNQSIIIEPVVQFEYASQRDFSLPNEESLYAEFDEANLFELSRFPAPDRREVGFRAATGLKFVSQTHNNAKLSAAIGQIYREKSEPDFSGSSGLQSQTSDLLIGAEVETQGGLSVLGRSLLTPNGRSSHAEGLVSLRSKRFELAAGYVMMPKAFNDNTDQNLSEWTVSSNFKANSNWVIANTMRYDLVAQRAATAGINFSYNNECASFDFTVHRRFTDIGSSPPSTRFEMTIGLKGFSTGGRSLSNRPNCGI